MVIWCYDTLYGIDAGNKLQPQMCAGHDVSADELTWTFTLRDGLALPRRRKGPGEGLRDVAEALGLAQFVRPAVDEGSTNEIVTLDDRRFQIRLKKPFRQMLYGLGARSCFMMPERMATDAGLRAGQGRRLDRGRFGSSPTSGFPAPTRVMRGLMATCRVRNRRVSMRAARWRSSSGSNGSCNRTRRPPPPPLQKGEVDWVEQPLIDLCPMLRTSPDVLVAVNDPFGWQPIIALNHLTTPFDNPKLRWNRGYVC